MTEMTQILTRQLQFWSGSDIFIPMPRDRLWVMPGMAQGALTVLMQKCYFIFRLHDGVNQLSPLFITLDCILKKTVVVVWFSLLYYDLSVQVAHCALF